MYCKECDMPIPDNAKKCIHCGAVFGQEITKEKTELSDGFCRKCGKKIPGDSVFCQYCGTKSIEEEKKNPVYEIKALKADEINENINNTNDAVTASIEVEYYVAQEEANKYRRIVRITLVLLLLVTVFFTQPISYRYYIDTIIVIVTFLYTFRTKSFPKGEFKVAAVIIAFFNVGSFLLPYLVANKIDSFDRNIIETANLCSQELGCISIQAMISIVFLVFTFKWCKSLNILSEISVKKFNKGANDVLQKMWV